MSEQYTYSGSREDWDAVWNIVDLYIQSGKVDMDRRIRMAEHKARIMVTETQRAATAPAIESKELQFQDVKAGNTYRFTGLPSGKWAILNGKLCRVEKKNRTKISVTVQEPIGNFTVGYRVTLPPNFLEEVQP